MVDRKNLKKNLAKHRRKIKTFKSETITCTEFSKREKRGLVYIVIGKNGTKGNTTHTVLI